MDPEKSFEAAMFRGVEILKREIGYHPTRFVQMLREHGGVGTARRLLASHADTSDGFARLWEARRLELSMEFHVLLPAFEELFTDDERETARRRLILHDFAVDAALSRYGDSLPE